MDENQLEAQLPSATAAPTNKRRTSVGRRTAPSRTKTEIELLAEISTKLDRVVAVLAAQGKDLNRQVSILASAGCDSSFIASYTGKTPGAIRNLPGWRAAHVTDAAPAENHG